MQAEIVTGRQQALAVERRYQVRMGAFNGSGAAVARTDSSSVNHAWLAVRPR